MDLTELFFCHNNPFRLLSTIFPARKFNSTYFYEFILSVLCKMEFVASKLLEPKSILINIDLVWFFTFRDLSVGKAAKSPRTTFSDFCSDWAIPILCFKCPIFTANSDFLLSLTLKRYSFLAAESFESKEILKESHKMEVHSLNINESFDFE